MATDDKDLQAGFTGTPVEKTGSATEMARSAIEGLKNEASAVSAAAADHPHTATTLLLTVSALAFAVGYAFGHSAQPARRSRFWN